MYIVHDKKENEKMHFLYTLKRTSLIVRKNIKYQWLLDIYISFGPYNKRKSNNLERNFSIKKWNNIVLPINFYFLKTMPVHFSKEKTPLTIYMYA